MLFDRLFNGPELLLYVVLDILNLVPVFERFEGAQDIRTSGFNMVIDHILGLLVLKIQRFGSLLELFGNDFVDEIEVDRLLILFVPSFPGLGLG